MITSSLVCRADHVDEARDMTARCHCLLSHPVSFVSGFVCFYFLSCFLLFLPYLFPWWKTPSMCSFRMANAVRCNPTPTPSFPAEFGRFVATSAELLLWADMVAVGNFTTKVALRCCFLLRSHMNAFQPPWTNRRMQRVGPTAC